MCFGLNLKRSPHRSLDDVRDEARIVLRLRFGKVMQVVGHRGDVVCELETQRDLVKCDD